MALERVEDYWFVCISISIFFLEAPPQYNEEERKIWDLGGDGLESFKVPLIFPLTNHI